MLFLIYMMTASLAFSATPESKTSLFNQIRDLRFRYRVNEYNLEMRPFGNQEKNSDLRLSLDRNKTLIDSLETEYVRLLSASELQKYLLWKHDEDQRDQSQSFNWWYPAARQEGC